MHPISLPSTLLLLALTSNALAAPPEPPRRVSLDVKDAEIRNVLRFLAELGRINLVVADEVNGRVTLHLSRVLFDDALAAVLLPKGLGIEQVGAIAYVDTLERITKRAEAKLALAEKRKQGAKLKTILLPVSYTRAESLLPLVKAMLSERGRAEVDLRTNTLIVTDIDPADVMRRAGTL
jgi:type IV pilus assembly protein PilQ